MATAEKQLELENLGSIITIKGTDNCCLGYLMAFDGKGIYCPNHGEVSRFGVTKEHADAHNKALDEAMLKGLDENCQIGQGNSFYLIKTETTIVAGQPKAKGYVVQTFLGTLVSNEVSWTKSKKYNKRLGTYSIHVRFRRNGKHYKGVNNGSDDLLNFKRVK